MEELERKPKWVIIKRMDQGEGKNPLNVILLDSLGEVKEWEDEQDAKEMARFLEENSDSGHEYRTKKI